MSKLLRLAYRLLIRNNFIRWTWLLALVLYGVKVATDKGLAWRRTPSSKTIFTISPADIESFTIQNGDGEDLTFSRQDTIWLAVNNVMVRLPEDSVRPYLGLFSRMERLAVKIPVEGAAYHAKAHISLFEKSGKKHLFAIFSTTLDSLSNEYLTFLTRPDERLLNGVRGDWQALLNKNFDDFRDHRLFNFSIKNANYMSFQNSMDTMNVSRKDSTWRSPYSRFFDPIPFKNHVENLNILRGGIFYDDDRDLLADRKISNRLIVISPTDTAIITAFRLDNFYVVHSSCNPNNYFKMETIEPIFFR
jgi:hypothetical protein